MEHTRTLDSNRLSVTVGRNECALASPTSALSLRASNVTRKVGRLTRFRPKGHSQGSSRGRGRKEGGGGGGGDTVAELASIASIRGKDRWRASAHSLRAS